MNSEANENQQLILCTHTTARHSTSHFILKMYPSSTSPFIVPDRRPLTGVRDWQRQDVGDKHPLPSVGTHQKYTPCNWGLLMREWRWGAHEHTVNETGYFAVSFSTCCAFGAGDNGCEIMGLARSRLPDQVCLWYTLSPSVKSSWFTFSFIFMQNYPLFKQTRPHLYIIFYLGYFSSVIFILPWVWSDDKS